MNDLELKLKNYLSKNTEIIEKSLKEGFLYYNCIIITKVEIDGDFFITHVKTTLNNDCASISPFLPIPQNFLRKNKLIEINKK